MYAISKKFDFCYGHRVYTQDCNVKYALEDSNPCKRIHGHQGTVSAIIESDQLDYRGFVIDFKELSFIKKFINDNLDHRFILSFEDPGFENLTQLPVNVIKSEAYPVELLDNIIMGWRHTEVEQDSFVFVDFNPTSENLARWIFKGIEDVIAKSPFKCNVKEVCWSETPKTHAIYTGLQE